MIKHPGNVSLYRAMTMVLEVLGDGYVVPTIPVHGVQYTMMWAHTMSNLEAAVEELVELDDRCFVVYCPARDRYWSAGRIRACGTPRVRITTGIRFVDWPGRAIQDSNSFMESMMLPVTSATRKPPLFAVLVVERRRLCLVR